MCTPTTTGKYGRPSKESSMEIYDLFASAINIFSVTNLHDPYSKFIIMD